MIFYLNIQSMLISSARVSLFPKTTDYQKPRRSVAITVLLRLTWPFDFQAIGHQTNRSVTALHFNTLQELFVFIFFILMPNGTGSKLKITPKSANIQRSDTQTIRWPGCKSCSTTFCKLPVRIPVT